jgi:hypothetical protein
MPQCGVFKILSKRLKTAGLRPKEREEALMLSCEESNERNSCQHVDRCLQDGERLPREREYESG